MAFDWNKLLKRLQAHPRKVHRFLPACPRERIEAVEKELGQIPTALKEMLSHFNGARLFATGLPLVSLFGLSITPSPPPLEWAPDWCIDKMTPSWRAAGADRGNDWAMAMMNYGGLILLNKSNNISEWDTAQGYWLTKNMSIAKWIEKVMAEGAEMMATP